MLSTSYDVSSLLRRGSALIATVFCFLFVLPAHAANILNDGVLDNWVDASTLTNWTNSNAGDQGSYYIQYTNNVADVDCKGSVNYCMDWDYFGPDNTYIEQDLNLTSGATYSITFDAKSEGASHPCIYIFTQDLASRWDFNSGTWEAGSITSTPACPNITNTSWASYNLQDYGYQNVVADSGHTAVVFRSMPQPGYGGEQAYRIGNFSMDESLPVPNHNLPTFPAFDAWLSEYYNTIVVIIVIFNVTGLTFGVIEIVRRIRAPKI